LQLVFRRKSVPEWLVLFIFVMPFFFFLLMDVFHMPAIIKYSIDIAWLLLLIALFNKKVYSIDQPIKRLAVISSIFFAFTLVGFFLNFQSIFYYLWGFRNNARFFIFFFACIFFLKAQSIEYYLRFLDKLFWINIPVVLFQFFVMKKGQDHLGGIFGIEVGCNGYTNIFLIIIVTKSLIYCLNNKETLKLCMLKCIAALGVATLSELKSFFIEFVVIVILAMAMTKPSHKKLWIAFGSLVGILIGIRVLTMLFPEFAGWFNLRSILETASSKKGYTSRSDMNRLTGVSIALQRFLPSTIKKIFGLGLGNCDYASYEFLTSPFYKAYGGLNYFWFSSSFLVLETGIIGLATYIYFFLFMFFAIRKKEKSDAANSLYCQQAKIITVMCFFLIVLNATLRTEAGFMVYFILALPFIKDTTNSGLGNNNTLKNAAV